MAITDRLIRGNALLGRYAFEQLRPVSVVVSACLYVTLVALVFVLIGSASENRAEFWRHGFIFLALLQILLLWIVGMYNAACALSSEVADKSMDFFRLLPLSASDKMVGILVGRNLVVLAISAINTLLLLICGWIAGVSDLLVIEYAVFTWVAGGAAMLLALLLSTQSASRRAAESPKALLVLALLMLPYVLGFPSEWHRFFPHGPIIPFYVWKPRFFSFLTVFSLFLGCSSAVSLIRRFGDERATFLSPAGLFGICSVGYLFCLGLFWPHLLHERSVLFGTCLCLSFFLPIAMGTYRTWDDYLEWHSRTQRLPGWTRDNLSNLMPAAGLCVIWTAFCYLADTRAGNLLPVCAVPVAMSFWLVIFALAEIAVVYAPLGRHVILLCWFLTALYVVLAPITAAVMNVKSLAAFSPFGYLALFTNPSEITADPIRFNLPILALLVFLIVRRYRMIGQPTTTVPSHAGES